MSLLNCCRIYDGTSPAARALARWIAAEEADGTSKVLLLRAPPGKRFGHGCMPEARSA